MFPNIGFVNYLYELSIKDWALEMGQPWSTLEGQLVTLSNAGATNWITSKKKCCRKHHFSSPTRPKITHTQNRKILHFALWSHVVLCRTYYVRRPRFHFKLHFIHSAVTLLFWLLKKTSQFEFAKIGFFLWIRCNYIASF